MATRMQQRRGTAAQWTAANPILAAGEIGFETDTNKFKMGNGSSTWTALQYFANAAELAAIVDGAPGLLNTLNELAAAIGDDPAFFTTVGTNLETHTSSSTNIHGIANTALLVTSAGLETSLGTLSSTLSGNLSTHEADTTSIHGISNTANLVYATDLSTHASDTSSVHGIADTTQLITQTQLTDAIVAEALVTAGNLTTHEGDTLLVHGISNTANLVYATDLTDAIAAEALVTAGNLTTHEGDTLLVHGISNTANLVYATDLSTHAAETENVHGIANTTALVTQTQLTDAINGAEVDQSSLAGNGLVWDSADGEFDVDTTVIATKTYADDAITTHNTDTTNVHGITDTSLLALKSEVNAITKTSLGLGNVDNTADASKPVSTAQSQAIATAKAEAIADATSQVNALLTGAPAALNTLDELAAALGDDANFAATVTTSLGLKVDSLTPISQKTASYTLSSLTERDDLIEMGSASALTLTIPPASSVDYPVGTSIDILQTGAGQVTIAAGAGVTVNATPGLKLRTTWSSCTLFKRAQNTWVVYGDLTA
jgi:hypothetical protein